MKELKENKNAGRDVLKKARLIVDKKAELETPEARIFLEFLKTYWMAASTIGACEMLWNFIHWTGENGIHLVDEKTVYCFPYSLLVRYTNLK